MAGKLEKLKTFVAVAELGSFSGAARRLNQSPPVVTRLVAELESELGVQLLVRSTRKVQLTAAGRLYAADATRILADLARVETEVRAEQNTLTGALKVSAPLSFGQHYLGRTISQFRILHPQVSLSLDLDDRFVDILREDYDMAIRISEPPRDKSTIWRKIVPIARMLVASPRYLALKGEPQTAGDLRGHNCLGYAHLASGGTWRLSNSSGAREDVALRFCVSCNNGDLLAELAADGEGIAMLPVFIVQKFLNAGTLMPVLTEWQPPELWLNATYPPYTHLPNKVRVFTEFLEQNCRTGPEAQSMPRSRA